MDAVPVGAHSPGVQHIPRAPRHDVPSPPDAPRTRFAASALPLPLLSAARGKGIGRESRREGAQGPARYWGAHAVLLLPLSHVLHKKGRKKVGRQKQSCFVAVTRAAWKCQFGGLFPVISLENLTEGLTGDLHTKVTCFIWYLANTAGI